MKIFWSMDEAADVVKDGAIAIGNFDGVHRGHQALIKAAKFWAGENKSGVLSFSPHPTSLLKKNHAPFNLMTDQEKLNAIEKCGADVAILHKIDEEFLQLPAEAFVREFLVKRLQIKHVIVGADFSFGQHALGTISLLKDLGQKYGFDVHIVDEVFSFDKRCSSSAIRDFLRRGDIAHANEMLGRQFSVAGTVVHGQKMGATLGFKTANIDPPAGFALANCIYATVLRVDDRDYLAATNVGTRPTVTDEPRVVIEAHILDRELDLYGKAVRIYFVECLRPEQKFSSLKDLCDQMARDCEETRALARDKPAHFQVKD